MNEENQKLLTNMLRMINGVLAISYVAFFSWMAVHLFNMIF